MENIEFNNKLEKPEKPEVFPPISEIDKALEKLSKYTTSTDEKIKLRQEKLDNLREVEGTEIEIKKLEQKKQKYNELKSSDYENLIKEGIIDEEYANKLEKLNNLISELESYLPDDLKEYLDLKEKILEGIDSEIEKRQNAVIQEIRKIEEEISRNYKEINNEISKIEEDPRVIEKLHESAKEEMAEFFNRVKEEREKIEQEKNNYIKKIESIVQSIKARHENSFNRMNQLIGEENVSNFLQVIEEKNEKENQSVIDKIRKKIIDSIIIDELKNPEEIVPWKNRTSIEYNVGTINYLEFEAIEKLLNFKEENNEERIEKLLNEINKLLNENKLIFRLVQSEKIDSKGKKKLFWAVFDKIKDNDKKEKKDNTKEKNEENMKLIKEAEELGSLVIDIPIINDKFKKIGNQKCALKLEKKMSGKNNEYWYISEIITEKEGKTRRVNGLSVGQGIDLDMKNAPKWLPDLIKKYFIIDGDKFINLKTEDNK